MEINNHEVLALHWAAGDRAHRMCLCPMWWVWLLSTSPDFCPERGEYADRVLRGYGTHSAGVVEPCRYVQVRSAS